ncbi:MAG: dTMP kinase [Gammaproteobacteria bacterium]|nr:dTMP kinase [Gammaproteobacteria bacterium]
MTQGLFITLEGIEGVGKTTQVDYVAELFRRKNRTVTVTREPGGTSVGEAIREILLQGKDLDICDETELLLIFAARAQHLRRIIEPALARNEVVICDRFTDASLAYQGGGRGIDMARIKQLIDWLDGCIKPELTLLLDAPVETGLARAGSRGELDRFETETIEFFELIRQTYLKLARQEPERLSVIDASLDFDEVQAQIDAVIRSRQY